MFCSSFCSELSVRDKKAEKQESWEKKSDSPPEIVKTHEIDSNISCLSHRASGTNVAAIDNKIEQAMVSFTTHTPPWIQLCRVI